MKTCSKCKVEKPLEEFSVKRVCKDGRAARCRLCEAAEQAERRKNRSPEEKVATEAANRVKGVLAKQLGTSALCYKCWQGKPATEFYLNKTTKRGLCCHCKKCSQRAAKQWRIDYKYGEKNRPFRRREYLKTQYGLTEADLSAILARQNGKCAICAVVLINGNQGPNALHIDHDHQTGKLRELLCHCCNTALGKFQDSEEVLMSAVEYLRKHKQTTRKIQ